MTRHLLILLAGWLAATASVAAAPAGPADVRLVVDVSAAMGRADPENLRGEALGMLLRLLPDDGRAGIWTYGQYVNMLVKYGESTPLWKETAAIQTADLASVGRRADLLAAIERAAWDRAEADAPADIVLLTDGRLDVSDDPDVNEARERRLLAEVAPELAAAGYRVHAVTVSDRADGDLLGQLSSLTGGYHGRLESAAGLPEGLLGVLGWVAQPASLPLAGSGAFEVAPGTRSVTVLRLGARLEESVALVTPGGERLQRTTPRTRLRWHVAEGYEMVTIPQPAPGSWRFEGRAESVRIFAYGDLRATYPDLPGTLFPDRLSSFDLRLESGGRVLDDSDFLELLEVSARLHGPPGQHPLVVDRRGDGGFRVNLPGPGAAGAYVLETRISGPTFEQSLSLPLVMKNPLVVEVRPEADGFVLWAHVAAADVDHDSLRLAAVLKRPPGVSRLLPLDRLPAGMWKLRVPGARGLAEVSLDLEGRYLNDRPFSLRTQPIRVVLPVTAVQSVNLGLDGRPLLVAPGVEPASLRQRAASSRAETPPPALPRPDPVPDELEGAPPAALPVWLAVAAAATNLALGLGVWWLVGAPGHREGIDDMLLSLRRLAGIPDDEEQAGEPPAAAEGAAAAS